MTHRFVLAALLATLASVGCAGSEPAVKQAKAPEPATEFDYLFPKPGEGTEDYACPAKLPGARVASIPTDSGVLLVFTTDNGMLELRRRAKNLAGELDRSEDDPGATLTGIITTTRYEEIPEGATVEVIAIDPSQSIALRDQLDSVVRQMQQQRDCPDALLAAR